MKFSAVILAGGESKRMGRDKAWVELAGEPLIARQIGILKALNPEQLFISGPTNRGYERFGHPVLEDNCKSVGPLGGIARALEVSTSPLVLVLAVDMPRMETGFLKRMLAECSKAAALIEEKITRFENTVRPPSPSISLPLGEGSHAGWQASVHEKQLPPNVGASPDAGCHGATGIVPVTGKFWQPLAAVYPKAAHELALTMLKAGDYSATRFAESCAETGLIQRCEVSRNDERVFENWNEGVGEKLKR